MTVHFTIDQHSALGTWLGNGMGKAAKKAALSTANRIVGIIQTEIIPAENPPPVFDGMYRASWRAEPTPEGADIFNNAPYASIIEYGARAENIKIGRLMIAALTDWARRKLGAIDPNGAAWAIAISMQKKGIFNRDGNKGLGILKKAIDRVQAVFQEELDREVGRGVK